MAEQDKLDAIGRNPNGTIRPGFVLNPNGRPKFSIVSILREKLAETPEGEKKTRAETLIDEILKKALVDKDIIMMKDIVDRIDGKPKQAIVGGEEDDMPLNHNINVRFVNSQS